jgi:hypothetical protein
LDKDLDTYLHKRLRRIQIEPNFKRGCAEQPQDGSGERTSSRDKLTKKDSSCGNRASRPSVQALVLDRYSNKDCGIHLAFLSSSATCPLASNPTTADEPYSLDTKLESDRLR